MGKQDGPGRELNAYEKVLAEDRRVMREMFRVSVGGAHAGLVITVFIVVLFAAIGGTVWALIVGGAVAFWFTVALFAVVGGGRRGWAAVKRAYLVSFGWAGWL
ncbi:MULTISPECIES: hypothetical protein [unclassified Streptomyces]|uniref:hypothetical protein n=1 Tax=Streptomyces TaxID=1883 RepID=UPI0001C194A1|nr:MULTISPECIES: hypothetical protein [unclassified Streptomyces]AEN13342.1 conserved hypothetical protein [Streptomyces sp. SirexAA-E]MYR65210.1 hypothetical protein [Streptomyces sp. SID4939]MYS04775.1 hypothetical protein [Streptomyces sp. SID4940]MYT67205.1 hypothetical protein [Streptomyces sp. SID8357]MYT88109.1 hypothetical protein [Streptomyces sp. SID8360]